LFTRIADQFVDVTVIEEHYAVCICYKYGMMSA